MDRRALLLSMGPRHGTSKRFNSRLLHQISRLLSISCKRYGGLQPAAFISIKIRDLGRHRFVSYNSNFARRVFCGPQACAAHDSAVEFCISTGSTSHNVTFYEQVTEVNSVC